MLLRVDVYRPDATIKTTAPDEDGVGAASVFADASITTLKPSQTLFVNLVTAAVDADSDTEATAGCLLTIGRKKGQVQIPQDKSVSREHVRLIVMSTPSTSTSSSSNSKWTIPPAHTPEQERACRESVDGMCLVMHNVGKFGSCLAEWQSNDNDANNKDSNNKRRSEHTSHAADGEAGNIVQPTLSVASQTLLKQQQQQDPTIAKKMPILKRMESDQSIVLQECSLRQEHFDKDYHAPAPTDMGDPIPVGRPVVVQCGKMGSTIVVQRYQYQFLRSTSTPQDIESWLRVARQFVRLGAREVTALAQSSHVVTSQRTSSPKQLTAWSRGIPAVQFDFVQALIDRTRPEDPLPDASLYEPTNVEGTAFWNRKANPALWSGCICLRLPSDLPEDGDDDVVAAAHMHRPGQEQDYYAMVESGGAQVLLLTLGSRSTNSEDAIIAQVLKILEDSDTAISSYFLLQMDSPQTSPSSLSLSRRLVEAIHYACDVPIVQVSEVATALSEQRLLRDMKGGTVGAIEPEQDTAMDDKDQPFIRTATDAMPPPAAVLPSKESQVLDKPTTSSLDATAWTSARSGGPLPEPSTASTTAISSSNNAKRFNDDNDVAAAPYVTSSSSSSISKRLKLPVGSQAGWLSAAPSGPKRQAYRSSVQEIRYATGQEEVLPAARTLRSKELVMVVPPASATLEAMQTDRDDHHDVIDFKAFRKNPVLQLLGTIPLGSGLDRQQQQQQRQQQQQQQQPQRMFRMRSVLPKEMEHRAELDEQERALEEQQRRADELFKDPMFVDTVGGRRRR